MRHLVASVIIILGISTNLIADSLTIWTAANIELTALTTHDHFIRNVQATPGQHILIVHGNSLHALNEEQIFSSVEDLRKVFSRVYLVPGAKEWQKYSAEEFENLGDKLDDEFKGDVIVPENGCGEIEIKEVGENLTLLFIDSHWYFQDWSNDRRMNQGCEVMTREEFWLHLADEYGGLKKKNVILYTSHPLHRFDQKGGHYSLGDYLFPLRDDIPGAYLPLPLIGHLLRDSRHYFTPKEHTISPMYKEFRSNLKMILKNHKKTIPISSHAEINVDQRQDGSGPQLQVHSNEAKEQRIKHDQRYLSTSSAILKMTTQKNGLNIEFCDFNDLKTLYQTRYSFPEIVTDTIEQRVFNAVPDTQKTRPIRYEQDLPTFNKFIFGELNRDLYLKEVSVPQIDLSKLKGGLEPIRLGGGQQTTSLRFRDENGQVYLARALRKRTERLVPNRFVISPVNDLLEYFFLSGNPVGFLSAPVLEEAADVLHTTPKLKYLPVQEGLKPYNDEIGNELVLFRERADEAWENKGSFGNSPNIVSSQSMIEELQNGEAEVDAEMYLRARLLDLLMNDWDRHSDQWRWARDTLDQEIKRFRPIPRDRDQVFSHFDGLLLSLVRPYDINLLQMRKFEKNLGYSDIKWAQYKSSYLDNYLLHQLTRQDWEKNIEFLKQQLTPAIVKKAVDQLPPSFQEEKIEIYDKLVHRISRLDKIAWTYHDFLTRVIIIHGTHEDDEISIIQKGAEIEIAIQSDVDDEQRMTFHRTIPVNESREIWIYGLDGDDELNLQLMKLKRKIRFIGGFGDDRINSSNEKSFSRIEWVDHQPAENAEGAHLVKYRFETDRRILQLSREDFKPVHHYFLPVANYQTDDGLTVGGQYVWNVTRFKSDYVHTISANFRPLSNSTELNYELRYRNVLAGNQVTFHVLTSGYRRQFNYVGGNESEFMDPLNQYFVFSRDIELGLNFQKQVNSILQVEAGPFIKAVEIDHDRDRFITRAEEINPRIFDRQFFAGVQSRLQYKNFDRPMKPQNGARLELMTELNHNLNQDRRDLQFKLSLAHDYYRSFGRDEKLTFSSKIRLGHIFGQHYLYESFQLGGDETLRGFVNGRFTGGSMVAQNMNLHVKIFDRILTNSLPSSMGITGSFDHGRVWNRNDPSRSWHTSFGAALWLSPFDVAVVSAGMHISPDGNQLRILFNWQF